MRERHLLKIICISFILFLLSNASIAFAHPHTHQKHVKQHHSAHHKKKHHSSKHLSHSTTKALYHIPGMPISIANALAKAHIPASDVTFVVQPVKNTQPIVNWNGYKEMHPASTIKTVTTFVSLLLLGSDYRWDTRVYRDGSIDSRGTLHGNLYIKGSGDPHLLSSDLEDIVSKIQAAGIRQIDGDIILDKQIFAPNTYDSPAFDHDTYAAYNVGPDPLLYSFKTLEFNVIPTQHSRPEITVQPPLTNITIENQITQSNLTCRKNAQAVYPRLTIKNGQIIALFKGKISRKCPMQVSYASVLNHDTFFEHGFLALWFAHKGTFHGQFRVGPTPAHAKLVVNHYGQPLSASVININKLSNNIMARNLFLTIGAKLTKKPATTAETSVAIADYLKKQRINMPGLVLENGSGLDHQTQVSSIALANLLVAANNSPVAQNFIQSLPIIGEDGTMQHRLTNSPVRGKGHIKTGTLNHVRAIAGYIAAANGQSYVIVSIINHPNAAAAQNVHDLFISWVYHGLHH